MNAKELYLRTIRDLEQKSRSRDRYELLRSSALMRQLIFDDVPLIHAANREIRLKFRFTLTPLVELPLLFPGGWFAQDIRPGGPLSWWPSKTVKLDEFMATNCLRCMSVRITIRQVIKFCANVKGGVHHGTPDITEAQIELGELDEAMKIGAVEASLNALPSIQSVLLAGLQPLTDEISKEFDL